MIFIDFDKMVNTYFDLLDTMYPVENRDDESITICQGEKKTIITKDMAIFLSGQLQANVEQSLKEL